MDVVRSPAGAARPQKRRLERRDCVEMRPNGLTTTSKDVVVPSESVPATSMDVIWTIERAPRIAVDAGWDGSMPRFDDSREVGR
jgi:hypothetical protein